MKKPTQKDNRKTVIIALIVLISIAVFGITMTAKHGGENANSPSHGHSHD